MILITQVYQFLRELNKELDLSAIAYASYLDKGKKFREAVELKKINSRVQSLLIELSFLLEEDLKKDASALLEHYETWTLKWDALQKELTPLPDTVFAFPNEHRFPREAASRLQEEYRRCRPINEN
jgi:hypothetical protein